MCDTCDTCDTLVRDSVGGVAPTGRPQDETSPFPQRKRLAAEDAWPARAAAKGLLMTLAATASKEELLVSPVYTTPRDWPPIRPQSRPLAVAPHATPTGIAIWEGTERNADGGGTADGEMGKYVESEVHRAKSIDLWTTKLPKERLHPHFRSLAASPVDRACLQRWIDGFADVNGNIAHGFQTTFSAAFWEIYLYKMFQSLGFAVERPKDRPDFVLDAPQGKIAAEAKIIDSSPGQSPVWAPIHEVPLDREAFYNQTSSKLVGALHRKLQHYRTYANEPAVVDRPLLLCVNPYDTPHFVMQGFGAMTRVLYQYCDPVFTRGASGSLVETGHRRVESFRTKSGTVVPFGFFLEPSHIEVSAVYFNPRATVSKLFADPQRNGHKNERVIAQWYMVATGTLHLQDVHPSNYRETLGDGGYLFLNAHARTAIDPEPFFKQGIAVCQFEESTRTLVTRTPTPFLKTRIAHGVLPDDYPSDLLVNNRPAHCVDQQMD